jgi:multiple sugar transport system substrate-binding protein
MMKKKWIFVTILVFISALIAAGCSSDTGGGGGSGDGEITIEYWQYHFPTKVELIDELIAEFEAEHPGIKVNHSTFPYDQYQQQVATMVPAGRGPDVINIFYGWTAEYVKQGFLQPLRQEAFPHDEIESEFFSLVESVKIDGEYWVLPTAVRSLALIYNTELFEEAGLDPDSPPTTWDELVDYALKTTIRDSNGRLQQSGLAWEPGAQGHHWFRDALLYQAGGRSLSDDRRTILWNETDAGLEAWKYYLSFPLELKTSERDFYSTDVNAFTTGHAAMNIDGSFRLGTLQRDFPDLPYRVAPLPAYKHESTYASFWANGITRRVEGEKLEAAEKFLQFLLREDVMERWLDHVGELPARESVALQDQYVNDPNYGPFIEQLSIANAHFFVDEAGERDLVIQAVDRVLVRGEDPEEVFEWLVEKTQELFDQYWSD